jgi:hypothetical protein
VGVSHGYGLLIAVLVTGTRPVSRVRAIHPALEGGEVATVDRPLIVVAGIVG